MSPKETGAATTLAPTAYAGVYENPEWGRIVIAPSGESLSLKFGNLSSTLARLTGHAFEVTLMPGNTARLTFEVGPGGAVSGLSMMGQTFAKVQPG